MTIYLTLGFVLLVILEYSVGIITPIPGWQGLVINTLVATTVIWLWPVWLMLAIIQSL